MTITTRAAGLRYNPDAPRIGPGVYCLDDIKQRCTIGDAGCWVWAMCCSTGAGPSKPVPNVGIPAGVFGRNKPHTIAASRAAWLMSGRRLLPGQILWRRIGCDDDCISPKHRTAGTRAEWGAWVRANGSLRGDPRRAITALPGQLSNAVPAAVVHEIAAKLQAGAMGKDLAVEYGIGEPVVSKIRSGRHIHQRQQVRAASVFALGNVDMRRFAAA
jgi:hypothetical protein